MAQFKPVLSAKIFSTEEGETEKNLASIRFPQACSIKYDGWRCTETGGQMLPRSLKPARNIQFNAVMQEFARVCAEFGYRGMDGEVIIGELNDPNAMQNTTSVLNSYHGDISNMTFLLFDSWQYHTLPFIERYSQMRALMVALQGRFPWVKLVEQVMIHNLADLLAYEKSVVEQGYEGIMVRDPRAPYKFGRSTMREQILMALKRFVDDDALVLEYWEELENTNSFVINKLGNMERSGHQENLVPKGSMGTMLCTSLKFEDLFNVGGGRGITANLRADVWRSPQRYQWRLMKYCYQDIGIRTRPRLPRYRDWRSWRDISPEDAQQFLLAAQRHLNGRPEYLQRQQPDYIGAIQQQYRPEDLT